MSLLTLRARILSSVATSTILVACGGDTTPQTPTGTSSSSTTSSSSSGTTPATCQSGRTQHTCNEKGKGITKNSGYGGVRDPDAAPPPPPTLDANGCIVAEEIMSGCCNPAIGAATVENGQCCYDFCGGACCGRPLVVDGVARVARARARGDWGTTSVAAQSAPLHTRAALADAYLRDALLEHASIASFATFTLELLAVGAPPALLVLAQAACSDEIEHARLTFAIANTYRDVPHGPSALDLRGITPSTDLATIAAATVRDGCINETIASAVAAAQSANATDPTLRATLARIADDEARHAELAWQLVRWALETGGAEVARAVDAAFALPVPTEAAALPAGVDEGTWQAHGRLLPSEHRALVKRVLEHVVAPCAQVLRGAVA